MTIPEVDKKLMMMQKKVTGSTQSLPGREILSICSSELLIKESAPIVSGGLVLS